MVFGSENVNTIMKFLIPTCVELCDYRAPVDTTWQEREPSGIARVHVLLN